MASLDRIAPTVTAAGQPAHGLSGDILVWNLVTKRRHELTSMGIRVTKETLVKQMKMAGLEKDLELPCHQAIPKDEIPLSIDLDQHPLAPSPVKHPVKDSLPRSKDFGELCEAVKPAVGHRDHHPPPHHLPLQVRVGGPVP